MNDSLLNAMAEAGVMPASTVKLNATEEIQRFQVANDKPHSLNGWIVSYQNIGYGNTYVFGSWKLGTRNVYNDWGLKASTPLNRGSVDRARRLSAFKKRDEQHRAALECHLEWKKATHIKSHPYLLNKQIQAHTARLTQDDLLMIPIVNEHYEICSLQYIDTNGNKRFKKGGRINGCCSPIGNLKGARRILICEGFATGATLHEETNLPVLVAFNAGNLSKVAMMAKRKYPDSTLLICADNDHRNINGNIGLIKATDAAKLSGAFLAYPPFKAHQHGSDFNDWVRLYGASLGDVFNVEAVA